MTETVRLLDSQWSLLGGSDDCWGSTSDRYRRLSGFFVLNVRNQEANPAAGGHEPTVACLTLSPGSGHSAAVVWVELGLARESHV